MFYPQFHVKNISLYNVFMMINHLSNFSRKKKQILSYYIFSYPLTAWSQKLPSSTNSTNSKLKRQKLN